VDNIKGMPKVGKYEVDRTYLYMGNLELGGICLMASLSLLSCKGLQFQKVAHAQPNSDISHEKGNTPPRTHLMPWKA